MTVLVSAMTGAMHQGAHAGHGAHGGHTGHSGGHTGHGGGHHGHAAKIGHGHAQAGQHAQGHSAQAHHAHHGDAQQHVQQGTDQQAQTGSLIRIKGHESHLSIEEDEPGIGIALLTYLNPNTIACFATWFGAIGIMLWRLTPLPLLFTLPIAIVGGAIGAKFMLWMVGSIGTKMYQSHTFRTDDIIGLQAEVTVPVQGQGMGEVVYVVGGCRYTTSARVNKPELAFPRGAKAIICDMRDDVAYIEPWTDTALAYDEP